MASLSVEPCAGAETLVTLFSVPGTAEDAEAFVQREHEFRFLNVTPTEADGSPCAQQAVVCAAYSDEEYKALRCRLGSSSSATRRGESTRCGAGHRMRACCPAECTFGIVCSPLRGLASKSTTLSWMAPS